MLFSRVVSVFAASSFGLFASASPLGFIISPSIPSLPSIPLPILGGGGGVVANVVPDILAILQALRTNIDNDLKRLDGVQNPIAEIIAELKNATTLCHSANFTTPVTSGQINVATGYLSNIISDIANGLNKFGFYTLNSVAPSIDSALSGLVSAVGGVNTAILPQLASLLKPQATVIAAAKLGLSLNAAGVHVFI